MESNIHIRYCCELGTTQISWVTVYDGINYTRSSLQYPSHVQTTRLVFAKLKFMNLKQVLWKIYFLSQFRKNNFQATMQLTGMIGQEYPFITLNKWDFTDALQTAFYRVQQIGLPELDFIYMMEDSHQILFEDMRVKMSHPSHMIWKNNAVPAPNWRFSVSFHPLKICWIQHSCNTIWIKLISRDERSRYRTWLHYFSFS